ncbi:DUF1688-domain-containing protein [Ramicandelaber brevisporus]|nr:DUF1688-domain-containing protein [Ramicandelaber brevisporus]
MTFADDIRYLTSLTAVSERSQQVFKAAVPDKASGILHGQHFDIKLAALDNVASFIDSLIKRDYPAIADIPPHSRWRHYTMNGIDRISNMVAEWKKSAVVTDEEAVRRVLDLFLVSVLLDAGAGDRWKFHEKSTGYSYSRSEGLAIAALEMFQSGLFSNDPAGNPCRVDADALMNLQPDMLAKGMQVDLANNPLVGLDGRCALLCRLGAVLNADTKYFGPAGSKRPGGMFDYLKSVAKDDKVNIESLWFVLTEGLNGLWPATRTALDGKSLGDVWPCDALKQSPSGTVADTLVPFHKLTQWLTYSLIEPIEQLGKLTVLGTEKLTGLPEYRNGGLFVDFGVLTLHKDDVDRGLKQSPGSSIPMFEPHDPVVVEWRALTVVLLGMVADVIRKNYNLDKNQLPLAKVLEAGTWKAGREIAAKLRPDTKGPPINIISDGTVF